MCCSSKQKNKQKKSPISKRKYALYFKTNKQNRKREQKRRETNTLSLSLFFILWIMVFLSNGLAEC